jgi:hypothetical protein
MVASGASEMCCFFEGRETPRSFEGWRGWVAVAASLAGFLRQACPEPNPAQF